MPASRPTHDGHARPRRCRLAALVVTALLGPVVTPSRAQSTRPVPPATAVSAAPATDLLTAARRVIAGAGYATFITLDSAGQPQARTVQPVAPDSSMVVWFATNPRTRKVAQLARDARATLHYFEPASLAYVTLIGRARVVRDRREKDAHWNPAWTAYYRDRDTSVVLIEFTPDRLEMVDIRRKVEGDPGTWEPASLQLRPRRPSR